MREERQLGLRAELLCRRGFGQCVGSIAAQLPAAGRASWAARCFAIWVLGLCAWS